MNRTPDYFWKTDDSILTLPKIRDRLVNPSLFFILILGLPGLASSLFRAVENGWQPVMIAQIVLYLVALATVIFRKRVSFYVRTAVLIGSFLLLGIIGLGSFGLAGVAVLTFAIVCLLTAVLLGTRPAIIALLISLLIIIIAAIGAVTGTTTYAFDANVYITSPSAWIFAFIGLIVSAGFSVIGIGAIQAHLQKALQASELRYKTLFDEAGDAIIICNLQGQILDANKLICDQLGYTCEQLLTMNVTDLTAPEFVELGRQQFAKLNEVGHVVFETGHVNQNGRIVPIELSATMIDREGDTAVLGIIRDITERQELETKLKNSEAQYRSIVEDLPGLVCSFLPGGIITFVNDAYCQYYDIQNEELIGNNFLSLVSEDDREFVMSNIESLTMTNPIITHEHQVIAPGGEERWQRWTNRAFFNDKGQILKYQSIGIDVSEKKWAELALQESEARLESIFLAAPVGIGVVIDRVFMRVNDQFCSMLGYSRDEIVGQSARVIYPTTEDYEYVGQAKYAQIKERNIGTVETRWLRKDGRIIEVLLSSTPIDPHDLSVGVTFSALDITERKRAEAALMESEERYRYLVEMSPDGIVLHRDNKLIYANAAAAQLIGAEKPADILGKPVTTFVHPEHWDETRKRGERMMAGEQGLYPAEDLYVRLDGTAVPVEVTVASLKYQGETAVQVIFRDISERKQADTELQQYRKKLENLVDKRTNELQQRVGEVELLNTGMLNLLTDLQAANDHVSRTAKQLEETNTELEAFAYSVSHDLRAPLRHISGFVTMLQKRESDRLDEKSAHYLQVIAGAAQRMGQLIDDLLAFSRTGRRDLLTQPVELNKLVADIRQELSEEFGDRTISWEIETLPTVTADPALLRQVWINLLDNAVKYTAPQLDTHIEVGTFPSDEDDHITFFVRDNGVGFDNRYVDKLFGVFQRLHQDDEFEGTGIGLATVRRIIHRHNGRTWADGEINQGATFYFTLPKG